MPQPDAATVIATLGLQPHPEGGHFKEVFRQEPGDGSRGAVTSIYFLLAAGEVSVWHRVKDATEIWYYQAGAPLVLTQSPDGCNAKADRLGPNVTAGEVPQIVVPAGHWQTAESLGAWTLVGCSVAPAFFFESFEMAPPDWRPSPDGPPKG